MQLSEEKITLNYTNWVNRLKKYECYSEEMINEIGDKIRVASFARTEEAGMCYPGAMIAVLLNKIAMMADNIKKAFEQTNPLLGVNFNMLMKVLLLQHISKCDIFVPETDSYWTRKGNLYKFHNDVETRLKTGERSVFLCQKYGIKLNEQEYDAMTCIDKEEDYINRFTTPLSCLVYMVNKAITIEQYSKKKNEDSNN